MKKIILSLFSVALVISAFAQDSGNDGVGGYGYTWKSSKDLTSGVTAKWVDITKRQGAIELTNRFTDDGFFGPVNFSFDFPYYWYKRNELYVGSNGFVSFENVQIAAPFPTIPIAGGKGDDYIAPFMTDLTFTNLDGSRIPAAKMFFWTDFKDSVVLSWIAVPYFNSGAGGGSHTFQAILEKNGNITYQYLEMNGSQDAQACVLTGANESCMQIGFENVNGKTGMNIKRETDQSKAVTTYFATSSANAPIAIKCFRPTASTYSIRDIAATYNNEPGSPGQYLLKNAKGVKLNTNLANIGLVATPQLEVKGTIVKGTGGTGSSTSTLSRALQPGEIQFIEIPDTVPTSVPGIYRFEGRVNWTGANGDQAAGNNIANQQIVVIDTVGKASVLVAPYDTTAGNSGTSFVGAQNFNVGIGNFIRAPYYPFNIKAVTAYVDGGLGSPAPPANDIKFEIYDDDGKNLFGVKDGSPGTILYSKAVLAVLLADGKNVFQLDSDIQINSGGVYVCVLQGGSNVGTLTDDTRPYANTGFEVTKDVATDEGFWAPSRERFTSDPMIGINIAKADINTVTDLLLDSIVSPNKDTDINTDSVAVTILIKNVRTVPVAGPFEIAYTANNRAEVIDTFPANRTIAPGASESYTFKKKALAPPLPKKRFDNFCARVALVNDFDLNNDTVCYGNKFNSVNNRIGNLISVTTFPNPAQNSLNVLYGINTNSEVSFEVYDLKGQMVLSQKLGNKKVGYYEENIDLGNVPSGAYLYRIYTNSGTFSKMFDVIK